MSVEFDPDAAATLRGEIRYVSVDNGFPGCRLRSVNVWGGGMVMMKSLQKLAAGLGAGLLGLGLTTAAVAGEAARVWARPSTASAVMLADMAACHDQAKSVQADPGSPNLEMPAPFDTPLGVAVNQLIWGGYETSKARRDFIPRCMRGRGYTAIALTDAEIAAFSLLKGPGAQGLWIESFYQGGDFADRLARANLPALPEARPEPFTYGALRIDPATLEPASGVVVRSGTLLRFKAGYRMAGKLRAPIVAPDHGAIRLAVGTPVRQALFPSNDRTSTATWWCVQRVCLTDDGANGWIVHLSTGVLWLPTDLDGQDSGRTGDLTLDVDFSGPPPPPLEGALVLRKVTDTVALVEIVATDGREWTSVWRKSLPLDGHGQASLPLWSRRLVLMRSGAGVTATLSTDGDGAALPYERAYE